MNDNGFSKAPLGRRYLHGHHYYPTIPAAFEFRVYVRAQYFPNSSTLTCIYCSQDGLLLILDQTSDSLQTDRSTAIDVHEQEARNHSYPSFPQDLLRHPTTGQGENQSCYDSQSQGGRNVYLQHFISTNPSIVLHDNTTETLHSKVESSIKETVATLIKTSTVYFFSYTASVISISRFPILVLSFIWLYFTGSLFFDVAHYALHNFSKSPYWILRRIGYLHEVHHLYFNRRLKFNDRYLWQNMICELPLELSCQLFGTWLGYLAAKSFSLTGPGFLSQELFHLVLIFEVIRSFVVAILEGRDSNHQSYSTVVPKDPHTFLVGPEYHAMHHVNPSAYISSSFRVFDWFLGTSYTLRSRRVTTIGLEGSFGQAMKRELQTRESVTCIHDLSVSDNDEKMTKTISNTDILLVSLDDSCESVAKIIDLFRAHYKPRPGCLLLPEVWYIGSPTPSSTSADKSFTYHARKYYDAEDIIYRHITVSKSASRFRTAVFGLDFEAKAALWWIRRGARYVPPTFPAAILRYFEFFCSS